MRKFLIIAFIFIFLLIFKTTVVAQDQPEGFYASTVDFVMPEALDAEAMYEFIFEVTNNAVAEREKADWIKQVDLMMPSQEYVVDENELTAPNPLYGDTDDVTEIDRWEVSFDSNTSTITWQCFGVVTSAEYGDIREGDTLSFSFVATTDVNEDGIATDGFNWILYSDEGNMVSGTSYIGEDSLDDDDNDDDNDDNNNDDDSGGGGCGC